MSTKNASHDLYGKKLRFHFDDGAMKGKAFDHTFKRDGTVSWAAVDEQKGDASRTSSDSAAIEKVGDHSFVASYLGVEGYTLTTAFDLDSGKLIAFASDGKDWSKQQGRVELLN